MNNQPINFWSRAVGRLLLAASLLLGAAGLNAQTTVKTLGGDRAGFKNGNTLNVALFNDPCGLAVDTTGSYLYVADRNNNAVRFLQLGTGVTYNYVTNAISKPVGVAVDKNNNLYILNFGNGTNGNVQEYSPPSLGAYYIGTIATNLNNVGGITLDSSNNIYLTVHSNQVMQITPGGSETTIATVGITGTALKGIVYRHNGLIAVCDSGRSGIYTIDPVSGIVTTNTGFNGAGDFVTNGFNVSLLAVAKFNQPVGIVETGDGTLIVADYGNNRCKVITTTGLVTNLYGITSKDWNSSTPPGVKGWEDGAVSVPDSVIPNAQAESPYGVAIGPDASIYTTEDHFDIIRQVTGAGFAVPPPAPPSAPIGLNASAVYGQVTLSWTASTGATNYDIERASASTNGPSSFTLIGNTASTTYVDTNVANGVTYFYYVTALNTGGQSANSAIISVTVPLPPVPTPQIGFVTFDTNNLSVFHLVSPGSYQFNNDATIIIVGNPNSTTYYNSEVATNPSDISDPGSTNGTVYSDRLYTDGLNPAQVLPYQIPELTPYMAVKAIGESIGGNVSSSVQSAEFQFLTATPAITGNNAALFSIGDATIGAQLYYTTDGSDPSLTNGVALGASSNSTNTWTVSLVINTDTLFKVRAYYSNFLPSGIASVIFSPTNFVANQITFGFASGEASSEFIGSPGQTFYAPVTLTTLPNTPMYALQFNIALSSVGTAPAPLPGALEFTSMLLKPIPQTTPVLYTNIPPMMYVSGSGFTNLETIYTNLNLLALGWVERSLETNLYNSLNQDLITFSQAHDDLFPNSFQPNGVIVGGYGFVIPPTAQPGQQYQIQLGSASASSDGVGAPGSSVYVATPTSGSLSKGAINATKLVTAGQSLYLAGDAYPFRWFNAGDFGSGELITNGSSDVLQVFESAVYGLNTPPRSTDFFDCMDSAGGYGIYDSADGYYTNAGTLPPSQIENLYNNNDPTTINNNLFGDGQLDVSDVYVTFVRAEARNAGVLWVQRFWTNGVRGARYTANPSLTANNAIAQSAGVSQALLAPLSATNQPKVNFSAGDILGSANQTVSVPINATVFGSYPLRVLLLNLSVVPLDGSPALTSYVTFTPASSLGPPNPSFVEQKDFGNYAAAWLSNTVAGVSGTTTIGYLNFTIPATATANSSYAIHFDHASGSPSGFASFPKQTLTGLITLSSRTSSYYNDGIPDSWRLRYFGTVYNYLTVSNADADGDGYSNWQEYVAGTDPTDPTSSLYAVAGSTPGQPNSVQWPSVAGKQYAIQRSSTLFPANWTPVTTVTGTGATMQFNDTVTGKAYYYRVQVQ